jgi:hypothetical protein
MKPREKLGLVLIIMASQGFISLDAPFPVNTMFFVLILAGWFLFSYETSSTHLEEK